MTDISLIKNWHEKAKEDYFSRYIFEYLAFEAFLKKYKYTVDEIIVVAGNIQERSYIQKIKNETDYTAKWKTLILKDETLNKTVKNLVDFLKKEPLISSKKWWGDLKFNYADCSSHCDTGTILDENDFINIVEFWYQVRNNLFHAGKNPDSKRDETLVMFAYVTLSIFLGNILLPEMEERTMRPAIWEEFEHKFFKGEAEVMVKIDTHEASANVYELLFVEDKLFPIILNGKQIDRAYVINKLSFNLTNLYGDPFLLKKEWDKIKSRATTPENINQLAVYFKDILPLIKEL